MPVAYLIFYNEKVKCRIGHRKKKVSCTLKHEKDKEGENKTNICGDP
jgi:hypothetical protein